MCKLSSVSAPVSVPVPVVAHVCFRFRFRFQSKKSSSGSVPIPVVKSVPVDNYKIVSVVQRKLMLCTLKSGPQKIVLYHTCVQVDLVSISSTF